MGADYSVEVVAIKPPNAKWLKMKEVWDSCRAADIGTPKEVADFFNGEAPDENGVVIEITKKPGCRPFFEEVDGLSEEGYILDISKLPKDATLLRVTLRCSY